MLNELDQDFDEVLGIGRLFDAMNERLAKRFRLDGRRSLSSWATANG